MNPIAHILAAYLAVSLVIPNAQVYLIPIAIFAIFVDFDHFPGYAKLRYDSFKGKKPELNYEQYTRLVRSSIQEPIGIAILELFLLFLYIFGIKSELLLVAGISIFMQWLVDFLTVPTRPFMPLRDEVVCLFFKTDKQRQVSELVGTAVLLALFVIVYF